MRSPRYKRSAHCLWLCVFYAPSLAAGDASVPGCDQGPSDARHSTLWGKTVCRARLILRASSPDVVLLTCLLTNVNLCEALNMCQPLQEHSSIRADFAFNAHDILACCSTAGQPSP